MSDNKIKKVEKYELVIGEEITEGDFCICNFHDAAMHFWFNRDQLLEACIVQKLHRTPNKIWFVENPITEEGFYANSFTKIRIIEDSIK